MFAYDSYADQQRRQRERDVATIQAAEKRERDRQYQQRLAQREKEMQARIAARLEENARKRAEREAAAEQRETERGDRILARLDAARAGRPYIDPRRTGTTNHGDPVTLWKEAVSEALRACGGNRQRAVSLANSRNPGLRESMLAAVNSGRTR